MPPLCYNRRMTTTAILVVEDHDLLREGLQIWLQTDGYRVETAAHGGEALQVLGRFRPDLILSDINMPVMDGYEFYAAVRANPEWLAIPFVFLTALGERDAVFAGRRLGAEDYLIKPLDHHQLSAAIRSRLERSQQLQVVQTEQAYEATLIMLANAIELRDAYTRGHVERVTAYAVQVAERLGLNESQLHWLRFGAILHDIGKIYIPENILHKPTQLTNDEWQLMRQHTLMGEELLRPVPFLHGAIPTIRSHHERWDGQGYPDGLAGEQIPLLARIVSVADCMDAMTTDRAYHQANNPHDALQEIRRGAGTRYDPRVVEAFLATQPAF